MNKIGKDAEERFDNSKFMLHAVRITKTKDAEFWRQDFWLVKLKAYGKVG